MVDYPAPVVRSSFGPDSSLMQAPLDVGPFELVSVEVEYNAVVTHRESGLWWTGEAYLDGVEFIDMDSDRAGLVAGFGAGDIDANDDTPPDHAASLDAMGLVRQDRTTANIIVARMRVDSPPYDDVRLRRAIQKSVGNRIGHQGNYTALTNLTS